VVRKKGGAPQLLGLFRDRGEASRSKKGRRTLVDVRGVVDRARFLHLAADTGLTYAEAARNRKAFEEGPCTSERKQPDTCPPRGTRRCWKGGPSAVGAGGEAGGPRRLDPCTRQLRAGPAESVEPVPASRFGAGGRPGHLVRGPAARFSGVRTDYNAAASRTLVVMPQGLYPTAANHRGDVPKGRGSAKTDNHDGLWRSLSEMIRRTRDASPSGPRQGLGFAGGGRPQLAPEHSVFVDDSFEVGGCWTEPELTGHGAGQPHGPGPRTGLIWCCPRRNGKPPVRT